MEVNEGEGGGREKRGEVEERGGEGGKGDLVLIFFRYIPAISTKSLIVGAICLGIGIYFHTKKYVKVTTSHTIIFVIFYLFFICYFIIFYTLIMRIGHC
jgi:hypothetical protein